MPTYLVTDDDDNPHGVLDTTGIEAAAAILARNIAAAEAIPGVDPDEHGLVHRPGCDRPPPRTKLSTLARRVLVSCPICRARALNPNTEMNR